ncbi:MAG: transglutaminase-like domain-containing protein [Candidatus Lokiarchaeota archaeon]
MNELEKYLQPTEFFDFNKKKVKKKAIEITNKLENKTEKVQALFYWVRDNIKYNMMSYIPQIKANFKASVTLRRGYGFCVSKAVLLSTFARALEIPARIHLVDIINHKISQKVIDFMGTNVMHYHGYSEILINDKWIKLAPVFDKGTAYKADFLPLNEFDGKNNALFSHYDPNGNIFVEYIKDRGIWADLPLKEIEKVFTEKYGSIFEEGLSATPINDNSVTYKLK